MKETFEKERIKAEQEAIRQKAAAEEAARLRKIQTETSRLQKIKENMAIQKGFLCRILKIPQKRLIKYKKY